MKVLKVYEYDFNQRLTKDFIESIQYIVESDSNNEDYKKVEKKILSDLKLNSRLIGTFGAGIGAFYPVVNSLMANMGTNIELTDETIVLATICAVTIIFLEEKKFKDSPEEEIVRDSKSMLEELKMKGVGNGIIKKLVKALKSTHNIFSIIGKHIGTVANGFADMFSYTAMLIPVMNAINSIIDKYDFTPETLAQNFIGLAIGITTIVAKHSLVDIFDKLKNKFSLPKKEIIRDIEDIDNIDLTKAKEIKSNLV